jgi:hypothetical protein
MRRLLTWLFGPPEPPLDPSDAAEARMIRGVLAVTAEPEVWLMASRMSDREILRIAYEERAKRMGKK